MKVDDIYIKKKKDMNKILIILGCLWLLGKIIRLIIYLFPKKDTVPIYTYKGEIKCYVDEYNDLLEKEEEYKAKKDYRIKPCCYEYMKGLLKYSLSSVKPLKPSDITDFELMFTNESKVDLRQLK